MYTDDLCTAYQFIRAACYEYTRNLDCYLGMNNNRNFIKFIKFITIDTLICLLLNLASL